MKARKARVQNAVDFTTVASIIIANVTVIYVLQNDINKTQIDWNLVKDVHRSKKAHVIKCSDDHICLFTSQQHLDTTILCYCETKQQCIKSAQPLADHTSSVNISLGMFVLGKVFGRKSWKPYVAQVSALDETHIK